MAGSGQIGDKSRFKITSLSPSPRSPTPPPAPFPCWQKLAVRAFSSASMALPAPRQPRAPDGQPRAPAAAGATRRVGPRVAALKLNRGDDAPHMWRPEGVTVKYWNRYFFCVVLYSLLGLHQGGGLGDVDQQTKLLVAFRLHPREAQHH